MLLSVPPRFLGGLLRIAFLVVVFLATNISIRAVLLASNAVSLAARDFSVALGSRFRAPDSRLLGFEPRGFAARYLAAANSPANSFLLTMLALVDDSRLRRRGEAES